MGAAAVVAIVAATDVLAWVLVGAPSSAIYPRTVAIANVAVFSFVGVGLWALSGPDRRAIWLGTTYLIVADTFTSWRGSGAPAELVALFGTVPLSAFLPATVWQFIRDFPRVKDGPGVALARRMVGATLTLGLILLSANIALRLAEVGAFGASTQPWLSRVGAGNDGSAYWVLIGGLALAAPPYALWRTRFAEVGERRRVRILLAGLAAGSAPILSLSAAYALAPDLGEWMLSPGVRPWIFAIVYAPLLTIPFTTAYAVLARKALNLRLVVRRAVQYALARYVWTGIALAPLVAFVWIGYANRDDSLAVIFTSSAGLTLLGVTAIGYGVLRIRGSVLTWVDRRFFREQYDTRLALQSLVERSCEATDIEALGATMARELDAALHLESVAVFTRPGEHADLWETGGGKARIPGYWRLCDLVESRPEAFSVDSEDPRSAVHRLPREERDWMARRGFVLLAPIRTPTNEWLGLIALGEKKSELPFTAEDLRLISLLGDAVGVAAQSVAFRESMVAIRQRPGAGSGALERPAMECAACGRVGPASGWDCPCGGAVSEALVPRTLSGRFRALERIGEGGMSVVYRALDLVLDRSVVLKVLLDTSPEEVPILKKEARMMAAASHPHLATLYDMDWWAGRPVLIAEFLEGGTLRDALADGPLPARDALRLTADLADALEVLHLKGVLHRDVKPSNVGFTGSGLPKLLDFGIAGHASLAETDEPDGKPKTVPLPETAAQPVAPVHTSKPRGTPLYLSPEALNGSEPDPQIDLWGLSVVLFEALTTRHPAGEGNPVVRLSRIAVHELQSLGEIAPGCDPKIAKLMERLLAQDPAERPSSAAEWARTVREVSDGLPAPEL